MKTIEVVAAIIEHEGRILATQRGYGDFKDGWEFPGGKMEPGETPEAAIVREIEEELKVTIAPKTLVTTVECDYPKFHLTMHCFLSSIVKGEICLVEHEAAKAARRRGGRREAQDAALTKVSKGEEGPASVSRRAFFDGGCAA